MRIPLISAGCALTGAACFAWFLLPVFTGRIVNIGNVTGLAVSACLLFYGLWRPYIHETLSRLWTEGGLPARCALTAAAAVLAAIFFTALVLTCMIARAALKKPAPDANVIVLGCEVRGERPSLMLAGRMDAAVAYLKEHPDAFCVASGGKGEGEMISEAECMFRYMTQRGIAPERILTEDRSSSTRENLLYSAQILKEAGLMGNGNIAVVTNEFHACRAHLIGEKLGLRCGTVASGTPWWLFPTFYVRELYGLLYQIFL